MVTYNSSCNTSQGVQCFCECWSGKTLTHSESKAKHGLVRCDCRKTCSIDRSGGIAERFEYEQNRWDPKDSELWQSRMKPQEIAVEVRTDADVQIAQLTLL